MSAGDVFMAVYLLLFWGMVGVASIVAVGWAIGWAIGSLITRRHPTVTQTFVIRGEGRLTQRQIARLNPARLSR